MGEFEQDGWTIDMKSLEFLKNSFLSLTRIVHIQRF